MKRYRAEDIEEFVEQHKWMMKYYIVAHTNFRPANQSAAAIQNAMYRAERDLKYALNCFSSEVNYGHSSRAKRKQDLYRPASFATLECIDAAAVRSRTLHINLLIGNIPSVLTKSDVEALFKYCWIDKAKQADDMEVAHFDGNRRLIGYTLKESQQANDIDGVWSVMNTHLPQSPVFADRG
jgi:hypothetical protein